MTSHRKPDVYGLGPQIHKHLTALGIETPLTPYRDSSKTLEYHIQGILTSIGLDLGDDSIHETPKRVSHMYREEVFWGLDYNNFPKMTTVENKMHYDEMISVRCQVKSFCEHHLVPFIGCAHVAYIPSTKVLGLSKFNRVCDFFSRRPQIQERLTEQISATLQYVLETEDVAVVVDAVHFCVQLRGVQDERSKTVTSKLMGRFRSHPELRAEFLALTRDGER